MAAPKLNQELVDDLLDNAIKENEYTEILDWTPEDIAGDMQAYSSTIEILDSSIEELVPFIIDWRKRYDETNNP